MKNTGKKMKNNDFEKILQKFYRNPTFVTFCDDIINDDII